MNRLWLILDCNFLCHRARYSMGNLSFGGSATGVAYGFLREVLALREQFSPFSMVFCWDSRYSKRQEVFPDYKGKRKNRQPMAEEEMEFEWAFRKQVKLLRKKYLPIIGFKNVFQQKGYESDDLLASVAYSLSSKDQAVIVTADHDLFQCIRPNVSMYSPRDHKQHTLQTFKKELGITPADWVYVKAIAGCDTDNVPGVKGVGEKTAILYLLKKIKVTAKTYKDIEHNGDLIARNTALVKLPYKGTKTFKLREDKLSQPGWEDVCDSLGFKSIRDKSLLGKRR